MNKEKVDNIEIISDNMEEEKELDNVVSDSRFRLKLSKVKAIKIIYYLISCILCTVVSHFYGNLSVELGDFGSIVPVLLHTVSMAGLSWCPILNIAGILLVFLEEKYKELSKSYLIITVFVTVISIAIQLFI